MYGNSRIGARTYAELGSCSGGLEFLNPSLGVKDLQMLGGWNSKNYKA